MKDTQQGDNIEDNEIKRLPKTIKLDDTPYGVYFGGTKESNDVKIGFIVEGTNKHYTIRIIVDKEHGKLIFDIHSTDESKKAVAIREGRSPDEAYESIVKMSFDFKELEKHSKEFELQMKKLVNKYLIPIKSSKEFEDSIIIPIQSDYEIVELNNRSKKVHVNSNEMLKLLESIHSAEDLDNNGFKLGIVQIIDENIKGALFKRDGKWYYFDMISSAKELILLLEPYMTFEGKITKTEFIEKLKNSIQIKM